MIKANIKFFGNRHDEYGMPNPYYSNLIIVPPWQAKNSNIATVLALSTESVTPNPPNKLVLEGGPEKAYEDMLSMLRGMRRHQGFSKLINKES